MGSSSCKNVVYIGGNMMMEEGLGFGRINDLTHIVWLYNFRKYI
jgi:hypothetical protein